MQGLSRVLILVLTLLLAGPLVLPPAFAQSTEKTTPAVKIDKRKLLVQPRGKDGEATVSFFEDPVLWAREKQQIFYGQMSAAIRKMKSGSMLAAAWTLVLLSFGYGVFHAAGPGHGKVVISAWLLATESELKRGILISAMSAVIQALTAIAIVGAILLLVSGVKSATEATANFLESASYALIGVMGLYLIWTAFRAGHVHALARARHGTNHLHHFDDFQPMQASDAVHVDGPDCGHAHVPEAKDVRGAWSLSRAFTLAFAVGIRPCTGALLVLIFANTLGLYWVGILSTFAMALGTFLTVSVIAAIAVYSKKFAIRMARKDERWLNWLGFGLRLCGGAAIAGLGTIMFLGSLGTSNAMM